MSSEENDLESMDTMSTVPSVGGRIGKILDMFDAGFAALSTVALIGIILVVMLQIVGRFFLASPPIWTAETSKYLFIFMVALASGITIRKSRNVNVELYQPSLSTRSLAVYQVLVCTLVGLFALVVLPYAWHFAQIGRFQHSPTLSIPMLYIFLSTVIMFALIFVYNVIAVFEAIVALVRGTNAQPEAS